MKGTNRAFRNAVVLSTMLALASGCLDESSDDAAVDPGTAGGSNSAPSISGSPATQLMATETYSFTPTASDPNGDALSFTASNLPRWASFNTQTGRLSGTPKASDAGQYSNISISVSDGSESASLAPFTIIVNDVVYGSVTLSWSAPTQNEDGSMLMDLDGYRLYWGKTPGNYTDSVTIDNESITTYVVDNIPVGTYEFVGTSFNAAGVESRYSNPATKVVR